MRDFGLARDAEADELERLRTVRGGEPNGDDNDGTNRLCARCGDVSGEVSGDTCVRDVLW